MHSIKPRPGSAWAARKMLGFARKLVKAPHFQCERRSEFGGLSLGQPTGNRFEPQFGQRGSRQIAPGERGSFANPQERCLQFRADIRDELLGLFVRYRKRRLVRHALFAGKEAKL